MPGEEEYQEQPIEQPQPDPPITEDQPPESPLPMDKSIGSNQEERSFADFPVDEPQDQPSGDNPPSEDSE